MINYKGLMHQLIEKEVMKEDMKNATGISTTEVAKIAKGEYITMKTLEKLCEYFDCTPDKLIKFEKLDPEK